MGTQYGFHTLGQKLRLANVCSAASHLYEWSMNDEFISAVPHRLFGHPCFSADHRASRLYRHVVRVSLPARACAVRPPGYGSLCAGMHRGTLRRAGRRMADLATFSPAGYLLTAKTAGRSRPGAGLEGRPLPANPSAEFAQVECLACILILLLGGSPSSVEFRLADTSCDAPCPSDGFDFIRFPVRSDMPSRKRNTARFNSGTSPLRRRCSTPMNRCTFFVRMNPKPNCVEKRDISWQDGNSERPSRSCRLLLRQTTKIGSMSERSFLSGSPTSSKKPSVC